MQRPSRTEKLRRKGRTTNPKVPTDQLWFHHPEMQERIRRAEASISSGVAARTDSPEEAQAFLDGLKK